MSKLLIRLLINAIALWVAVQLVRGITYENGWLGLLAIALIFGVVNAFIRPVLKLLTCPLILVTLGLFTLVINALMLWLTSAISQALNLHFVVRGFWPAFVGGLIVSIVSIVLSLFVKDEK